MNAATRTAMVAVLLGAFSMAGTARAGTQDDAVIALHATTHVQKSINICGDGLSPEDPNTLGIPCSDYEVQWPLFTSAHVYLVVARGNEAAGISAVSCGILYGSSLGMYDWTNCAGLGYPNHGWPASGGGNRIVWTEGCQRTVIGDDGVHAVAGAFYVYAYGNDRLDITRNYGPTEPELRVADCDGVESEPVAVNLASVGFGTGLGCNTCLDYCTVDCDRLVAFEGEDATVFLGVPDTVDLPIRNLFSDPLTLSVTCSVDGAPLPTETAYLGGDDTYVARVPVLCSGDPLEVTCVTRAVHYAHPDCVTEDTSSVTVSCFDARPVILSVTDVPGDQGGWVWLRFSRSPVDAAGEPVPVLTYEVFRRAAAAPGLAPPAGGTEILPGWDRIGFFGATQREEYLYRAPTETDSSAADPGITAFRVVARTDRPGTFFVSLPDSGYSVGNLQPEAPLTVLQNQPNPFRERTTIALRTGEAGVVQVRILDLAGREVARPFEAYAEAGETEVVWDGLTSRGRPAPAGVYFYQVVAPGATATRRLIVLR